jgi:hypothetical protein
MGRSQPTSCPIRSWPWSRRKRAHHASFDHSHDRQILDQTAEHLAALGYTRLDTYDADNPPDVVVTIRGIAVQNTDIYVSYPWWGYWGWYGWPCCYGPGWGVGYPVVTATSTTWGAS